MQVEPFVPYVSLSWLTAMGDANVNPDIQPRSRRSEVQGEASFFVSLLADSSLGGRMSIAVSHERLTYGFLITELCSVMPRAKLRFAIEVPIDNVGAVTGHTEISSEGTPAFR